MIKIREHLLALATLCLLHVIIFAKLIFRSPEGVPYATIPFDFSSQYSRWLIYIGDSFQAGIIPRWVPYVAGGAPFFINPQSQLYSPLTLVIASTLGYSQRTAQLQSVAMILFGGVGAYLLSHSLWKNAWAALVSAICFNFSSAVFTNLEHMTITNSFALMPWLLWATTIAARPRNKWVLPVISFLLYFLITSGYPGVIVMFLLWLVIYTAYVVYFEVEQNKLRLSFQLSLAWLCGLGLSAVHWLPILIHRQEFTRGAPLSMEQATSGGNLLFKHLWGMVFQFMPTSPLPGTDVDISMRGLYFGALALPLALAALFFIKERIVSALLLLSVGSFLMACGSMFFGRIALHILIPTLNFSRFPAADSRALAMLGLVVLAGGGAKLLAEDRQGARTVIKRACVGLIVLLLAGMVVFRAVFDPETYNNYVVNFITAEIIFVGLALLVLHIFSGKRLMICMVALLALELGTCVLANFKMVGAPVQAQEYRDLRASHRRTFSPESASLPRLAKGSDLFDEDSGRGYTEKLFFLTDHNGLRLWRFQRLVDNGFTDWLTNGKRVVAFPAHSQPTDYASFQREARPVDYAILSYTPNQVRYRVRTDEPALLVFNEIFFKGWRATIDGKSEPVREVCGGLRALETTPGEHIIVMTFKPSSFYWGLAISLCSTVIFIVWSALAFWRWWRLSKDDKLAKAH